MRRVLAGTMQRAAGRQRSGTAVATPCWAILTPKMALRAPMTGVRSPAAPASMRCALGGTALLSKRHLCVYMHDI